MEAAERTGRILITRDDEGFKILDLDRVNGERVGAEEDGTAPGPAALVITLDEGQGEVFTVSLDGKRLAYDADNKIVIIDTASGEEFASIPTNESNFRHLAFSANGQTLVAANESCVTVWDLIQSPTIASGIGAEQVPPTLTKAAGTERCQEHLDITALAVANKSIEDQSVEITLGTKTGRVHFLRRSDGKISETVHHKAHNEPVSLLVFRPDNKAVMSVGKSRMGLWSVTGRRYAQFSTPDQEIKSVRFSADGQQAVSASVQPNATNKVSVVRVWSTAWREWLSVGCLRLAHHNDYLELSEYLTPEQRERVLATRKECEAARESDAAALISP